MEPEPLTFTAYAIGLVCVVAGSMQMRAIAFGSIAAKLLAAAGHESARAEKVRNGLAGVRAALTFATGCGLLALSRWTPVVTFSSILAQVAVLCWSQGAGLSRGAKGRGGTRQPHALVRVAAGRVRLRAPYRQLRPDEELDGTAGGGARRRVCLDTGHVSGPVARLEPAPRGSCTARSQVRPGRPEAPPSPGGSASGA